MNCGGIVFDSVRASNLLPCRHVEGRTRAERLLLGNTCPYQTSAPEILAAALMSSLVYRLAYYKYELGDEAVEKRILGHLLLSRRTKAV